MTTNDYLTDRVDNQIDWYDKKSSWNQRLYKRLQILQIAAAASIPIFAGFITPEATDMKHVVASIGALIAIISGILSLYKFQENWIQYRTVSESLKHQKYLFLTKTYPYHTEDAYHVLVETVENLIAQENSKWSQYIQQKEKTEGNNKAVQKTELAGKTGK